MTVLPGQRLASQDSSTWRVLMVSWLLPWSGLGALVAARIAHVNRSFGLRFARVSSGSILPAGSRRTRQERPYGRRPRLRKTIPSYSRLRALGYID